MSLTSDDKQWIKGAITEGVLDAINEVVLPKLVEHDERFEQIDSRFEQIDSKFEQIDSRFNQIDRRFDAIDAEIRKIHTEQTEMKAWMERIDGRIMGIESDIKEIYDRIVVLEKKAPELTGKEQAELSRKLTVLFDWAKAVSEKTGVALPKL